MTELSCLIAFLRSLLNNTRGYPTLTLDIALLERIHGFIQKASANTFFEEVITDLCRLDDAVVTGLSRGVFVYNSKVFVSDSKSTLPRLFRGLLTRVFNEYGLLHSNFDADSVEIVLQSLRLVRRAKSKQLQQKAEAKAVSTFFQYQDRVRPGVKATMDQLSDLWVQLEGDSFHEHVVLGKPGNGVCNDMRFPYVPDLCFPDVPKVNTFPENVRFLLTKARDDVFLQGNFPFDSTGYHLPNSDLVGVYGHSDHSTAKLAVVPKKYNEGRAITTTTVFATIVGATLRQSIFRRINALGARSIVNVTDQSLSHKTLRNNFHSVSCVDLEGGSSCLTTKNLDYILSKTEYIGDCWKASRPSYVTYKGQKVRLNTLTMGDAASVALLSGTLFLVLVLAYKQFHKLDNAYPLRSVIREMVDDGRFNVVGDDLIFPDYLIWIVRRLLTDIGVTINERKSSRASSHHKESCGSWFITDTSSKTGIRQIYPFRAAVPDEINFCKVTQVIEQFLEKVPSQLTSYSLYQAHTMVLLSETERIHYDSLKSHSPSIVGTRFGKHWSHVYRSVKPDKQLSIDDSLAYVCRIREGLVTPRYTRKSFPPRLRHRKVSTDLCYASTLRSYYFELALVTLNRWLYCRIHPSLRSRNPKPVQPIEINPRWTRVRPSIIKRTHRGSSYYSA